MDKILRQTRILTKRYFELTGNSLKISVTKQFKYYEEEFSFEEIGKKVFKKKSFNRAALTTTIIFIIGVCVTLLGNIGGDKTITPGDISFYAFLSGLAFMWLLTTYTNNTNLMLVDGRYITFYSNSPSTPIVDEFIELIFSEQKSYLLNKYAKREQFLSLEKLMDQIIWLKERDIIDDIEFENLKISLFPNTSNNPPIGFTFNSSHNSPE
jgi:hypothetical protein